MSEPRICPTCDIPVAVGNDDVHLVMVSCVDAEKHDINTWDPLGGDIRDCFRDLAQARENEQAAIEARDDYAARLKATDHSWMLVAGERDAANARAERAASAKVDDCVTLLKLNGYHSAAQYLDASRTALEATPPPAQDHIGDANKKVEARDAEVAAQPAPATGDADVFRHPSAAYGCERCGRWDGMDAVAAHDVWALIAATRGAEPWQILCLWCMDTIAAEVGIPEDTPVRLYFPGVRLSSVLPDKAAPQ